MKTCFGKENFSLIFFSETGRALSTSARNCPTPQEEGIHEGLIWDSDARYGFPSISKLRKWFGKSKKTYACMEKYGFVLRKYIVNSEDMFKSPTQCIVKIQHLVFCEELSFDVILTKKP